MAENHEAEQFKLPEDFDFQNEVGSVKFGLMMNYRYGYEKRYEREVKRIRKELKEHFTDNFYVDKLIERIVLTAERNIPKEFYQCLKK